MYDPSKSPMLEVRWGQKSFRLILRRASLRFFFLAVSAVQVACFVNTDGFVTLIIALSRVDFHRALQFTVDYLQF